MARKEILERIERYVDPFRITKGKAFHLKDFDPGDTCGLRLDKSEAADLLQLGNQWLADEQDMLYAQDRWSLLLVFQAMDAAGKDGTIKHVMSGVNPQGCQVFSFKQPSQEELDHDFLWRYAIRLPERGRIGIFNRSYYEEVLVVRVHEDNLKRQKLPALAREQTHLGRAALRHCAVRGLPHSARHDHSQVLPARVAARSRKSASWSASTTQTNIGNFQRLTCTSASSGAITCTHSRKPFEPRHRNTRRGTSCRLTINGLRGFLWPRPLSKRWRNSTSLTRRSMRTRRRNCKPFALP